MVKHRPAPRGLMHSRRRLLLLLLLRRRRLRLLRLLHRR
jgi:hypothetical protein